MWLESRVKKSDFEHLKDRWTACLIQKQRHTKLSQVTGRSGATGRSISGCLANPCIFLELPHIRHPSSNVESRRYWRYCICEVIAVKHCKTPVSYPTPDDSCISWFLWEAWVSVVRPGQIWNPRHAWVLFSWKIWKCMGQDGPSPCTSESSESYIWQWYLCYSLSLRSRFCLLAAPWLNRFSSLVMPTLRRASADSRVTAVRCTRCVRPAVANHYTKIILQTKGLAAIGGQLKMAFVPHRKRQGQRHAESMLTGKWFRASYYLRKHLNIGLWPHLLWIGRKGTGSRYLQDLRGPEHSLHQVIQYC